MAQAAKQLCAGVEGQHPSLLPSPAGCAGGPRSGRGSRRWRFRAPKGLTDPNGTPFTSLLIIIFGLSTPVLQNKISWEDMKECYHFNFDRVFEAACSQEAIFEEVEGLVQSALDGYKVCIFAYGQTGSGKTYTMQGSESSRGLIPRCLVKILKESEAMKASGWEWTLRVSFLEVYNEVLRDLLGDGQSLHVIKHDELYGAVVTNMSSVEVKQLEEIQRLMARANQQRAMGATEMNASSSRSHSCFCMYLSGVNRELGCELHGALHLVDLAGSERLDKQLASA